VGPSCIWRNRLRLPAMAAMRPREGEPANPIICSEPEVATGFDDQRPPIRGRVLGKADERHAARCGDLADLARVIRKPDGHRFDVEEHLAARGGGDLLCEFVRARWKYSEPSELSR